MNLSCLVDIRTVAEASLGPSLVSAFADTNLSSLVAVRLPDNRQTQLDINTRHIKLQLTIISNQQTLVTHITTKRLCTGEQHLALVL